MAGQRHHISTALQMFAGDFVKRSSNNSIRGIRLPHLFLYRVAPALTDEDGIAAAQARGAAGDMTINGALASGGVATFDVPRCVIIDSANAGDTTQVATVYGTDVYGETLVENITFNGTTAVQGNKAFKTVTRIAISAATAGNINAGSGTRLGLPYKCVNKSDVLAARHDGAIDAGTVVAAVATSPATATTGDVRGTFAPASTMDGTKMLTILMYLDDTSESAGGVAQFAG